MSNAWLVVLKWGGRKINTRSGVDYENGYYKTTTLPHDMDIFVLHEKIREVLKLSSSDIISKVELRYPISTYGDELNYTCLELYDNDDLNVMLGIINGTIDMCMLKFHIDLGRIDEAGTSNYEGGNVVELRDDGEDDGEDENEEGVEEDEEAWDEGGSEDEYADEEEEEEDEETWDEGGSDVGHPNNFSSTFFPNNPLYTKCDSAAMTVRSWEERNDAVVWNSSMNLAKGMLFESRKAVQTAAKDFSHRIRKEFCSRETKANTITLVCRQYDDGCKWRLRASCKKKNGNLWEITRYQGEHTCDSLQSQDNRNVDTEYLFPIVEAMVKKDATLKIRVIQSTIKHLYKVEISYKKAWLEKMKAIASIYGDWTESYNHLRPWMHTACAMNVGSHYAIEDIAYWVNGQFVPNVRCFDSVTWFWKPCIEGFKYCEPILYIDGTFLTGKYKGVLLIASALDGNNKILPVGFSIVEVENNENWGYFMRCLREIVCPDQPDVCVVSDRHASILAVMRSESWEMAPHRYCIRHLASNYNKEFKNVGIKKC